MKYNLARSIGLKEPPDGYTPEEVELEVLIANNTIETLYAKLPTSRMKFIVAAHFELGYPQEVVAEILGIKQPTLFEEIELIKMVLNGYKYKPRKFKDEVSTEDVLAVIASMAVHKKES